VIRDSQLTSYKTKLKIWRIENSYSIPKTETGSLLLYQPKTETVSLLLSFFINHSALSTTPPGLVFCLFIDWSRDKSSSISLHLSASDASDEDHMQSDASDEDHMMLLMKIICSPHFTTFMASSTLCHQ